MKNQRSLLLPEIITSIEGINRVFARKLSVVGVNTRKDLIEMDIPSIHNKTKISIGRLEMWRSMSALQLINGIDKQIAEAFAKAGINNLSRLIATSPDFLLKVIKKARTPRWIVNIIPDSYRRIIILSDIISWQNEAKELVTKNDIARHALIFKPWVFSRQEWGAVPPTESYIPHIPARITIHHTAGPKNQSVKEIQKFHIEERGYRDIGYHYLIDACANIYEGRPPTVKGAHVKCENSNNIGIAVIGNYDISDITETQHRQIVELGAWLCNTFSISINQIYGHCEFKKANTICPGRYLQARISRIKSEIYDILNPTSPPPSEPPPPSSSSGCFITTAAYGSSLATEVQFFRSLRDNIIRKTRWGNVFFDEYWKHYYKISPQIADAIRSEPTLKSVVSWSIITPLLNYLKLAMSRPSVNINNVRPVSVKKFMKNFNIDMEEWLAKIPLPESFEGMSNEDIVDELGIVLNFVLREKKKQKQYLNKLVCAGKLPLKCPSGEARRLSNVLKRYKIPSSYISNIVSSFKVYPGRKK